MPKTRKRGWGKFLFNRSEAAVLVKMPRGVIQRMVSAGQLETIQVDHQTMIPRRSLAALYEQMTGQRPPIPTEDSQTEAG